jgi:hypothetical protein
LSEKERKKEKKQLKEEKETPLKVEKVGTMGKGIEVGRMELLDSTFKSALFLMIYFFNSWIDV